MLSDFLDAGYINIRHYQLMGVKKHLDAGKGGWGGKGRDHKGVN